MSDHRRVTLAIPCFNAAPTLGRVLRGVDRLRVPPDELLVVDDGSTDACGETARRFGARVVTHTDNRGLAAARNTALQEAQGEIVVFLDADAVPDPGLLQALTAGRYADPNLAGVGGQLLERSDGALADRWRSLFWRQTQGETPLDHAPFLVGACCSLRRRVALELGGFSARFRTNGEDVELSARLRDRGYRLAYEPRARACHLRHDGLHSLLSMVFRHSRDQVLALRAGRHSPVRVVVNAVRWGPVTLYSSLLRHRSLGLAALSPACHAASLAGCAAGLLASGAAR